MLTAGMMPPRRERPAVDPRAAAIVSPMARSWAELLGEATASPESDEEENAGFFNRLRESLGKSRRALLQSLAGVDAGDAEAWERLQGGAVAARGRAGLWSAGPGGGSPRRSRTTQSRQRAPAAATWSSSTPPAGSTRRRT